MAFSFSNLNFKFKPTLHYNKKILSQKIAFLFSLFLYLFTFRYMAKPMSRMQLRYTCNKVIKLLYFKFIGGFGNVHSISKHAFYCSQTRLRLSRQKCELKQHSLFTFTKKYLFSYARRHKFKI